MRTEPEDRELILHIGTIKTGSSSIQKYFVNHGARRQWIYPNAVDLIGMGHQNLAYEIGKQFQAMGRYDPKKARWKDIYNQIAGHKAKKVILSSGVFSFMTDEELQRLRHVTRRFAKVTIVVYLRRIDDWLHGRYIQNAKFGRVAMDGDRKSLKKDLLAEPFAVNGMLQGELVTRWQSVFGAENVRVYPFRKDVIGNCVLTHFVRTNKLVVDHTVRNAPRINESPPLKALVAAQVICRRSNEALEEDGQITSNSGMAIRNFFADREDFVTSGFKLIDYHMAKAFWMTTAKDREILHDALNLKEPMFEAPKVSTYRGFIQDPMSLASEFSDEENDFIEKLVATRVRFRSRIASA